MNAENPGDPSESAADLTDEELEAVEGGANTNIKHCGVGGP